MNLVKTKADQLYKKLLQSPKDITSIIGFYRNELNAIIQVEQLLRQCTDDISYTYNLPLMKQELDNVRTKHFDQIKKKFGFFSTKEKYYFDKLIEDL